GGRPGRGDAAVGRRGPLPARGAVPTSRAGAAGVAGRRAARRVLALRSRFRPGALRRAGGAALGGSTGDQSLTRAWSPVTHSSAARQRASWASLWWGGAPAIGYEPRN